MLKLIKSLFKKKKKRDFSNPLEGGKVYIYEKGATMPRSTYDP